MKYEKKKESIYKMLMTTFYEINLSLLTFDVINSLTI